MKTNTQLWRDAYGPQFEDGSYVLTSTTFKIELPFPKEFPIESLKRRMSEELGIGREVLDVSVMVRYKTRIVGEGF